MRCATIIMLPLPLSWEWVLSARGTPTLSSGPHRNQVMHPSRNAHGTSHQSPWPTSQSILETQQTSSSHQADNLLTSHCRTRLRMRWHAHHETILPATMPHLTDHQPPPVQHFVPSLVPHHWPWVHQCPGQHNSKIAFKTLQIIHWSLNWLWRILLWHSTSCHQRNHHSLQKINQGSPPQRSVDQGNEQRTPSFGTRISWCHKRN